MPADLHIHSNFSDGTESPAELVRLAKAGGLTAIALTDHDIIDGIGAAEEEGSRSKVEVIPGIELTTESPGAEIHILGYFIDYRHPSLTAELTKIQEGRVKRIYKIVKKLRALKIEIDPEEVFALSGSKAPGRPHVARALIKSGAVANFKEAFNRYLDHRSPAYVPHYKLSPEAAIKLIIGAGGIPVFAHPAISNADKLIPQLVDNGLRGLEIYYPGYTPEQIAHYLEVAGQYNLLVTGGSDYHGANSGRDIKLGDLFIPDELMTKLREAKKMTND
ncbi:MAG TPA: PHP domain-containing protein [Candidatus Sulfotelmatobacter sp.]|nr:PHP domain-containing protein [Candidatus Sulfotelmatobacter sp.]